MVLLVASAFWFQSRGPDVPPDRVRFHGRVYKLSGPAAEPADLSADEKPVGNVAMGGVVYVSTNAYQETPVTIEVAYAEDVYGYGLVGGP